LKSLRQSRENLLNKFKQNKKLLPEKVGAFFVLLQAHEKENENEKSDSPTGNGVLSE
jgi:hypothetical protein